MIKKLNEFQNAILLPYKTDTGTQSFTIIQGDNF